MLPVVGDVAQSDRRVSRGAKGKLGIAKTCLGMMLSKMLVRISHGSTHGKVRTRNLARINAKSSLAMAWNSGRKAALGSTAPT